MRSVSLMDSRWSPTLIKHHAKVGWGRDNTGVRLVQPPPRLHEAVVSVNSIVAQSSTSRCLDEFDFVWLVSANHDELNNLGHVHVVSNGHHVNQHSG